MKNLLFFALLFVLLTSFSSQLDDVVSGIKEGNASRISKYFDNTIELNLPDKSNSYSKTQAELVLQDFFSRNSVKNFSVMKKDDNVVTPYCVGTLQTSSGIYRTTFYMKQKGDKVVIQELTFEK